MSAVNVNADPAASVLELVFRNKWKIITFPTLVFAAAALVLVYFPRTYISEARVLVQVGRESVGIDPTASTGPMISLMQSGRDDEMTSAMDVIRSRAVIAKVVDRLGPDFVLRGAEDADAEPIHPWIAKALDTVGGVIAILKSIDPVGEREEAIIALGKAVYVNVERGSTVLKFIVEAETPSQAQKLLDELIVVYREEHSRIHRNQNSKDFFATQLDTLEQGLASAQEELRDAKNEIGIVSVAERRGTLEAQRREIESARYSALQELARVTSTIKDLRGQIETVQSRDMGERKTVPNEGADELNSQLYALKVKRLDMTSRLREDHPAVQAITRQIEEAQAEVEKEKPTRDEVVDRVNPIYESVSLQIKQQQGARAGIEGLLETLDGQQAMVMKELSDLNVAEVRIDDLSRKVAVAEKQFFRYSDDLEQARIDAELEEQRISNISVVQPAALIEKPVSPAKLLVLAGAMFLAVGGTASWVLMSERFDSSIRTPSQAEALLGVPTMATLPRENRIGQLVG
jgi:polysaccharide biosynthesis protein PslE